ncbi:MAG: hypothetical protein DHS20C17_17890 [Cyclobacteriaceae bacterium]|nr:MAG: hypothetical protein DHS20C17_17890 [Cyclobacteriaceae bacterium]
MILTIYANQTMHVECDIIKEQKNKGRRLFTLQLNLERKNEFDQFRDDPMERFRMELQSDGMETITGTGRFVWIPGQVNHGADSFQILFEVET